MQAPTHLVAAMLIQVILILLFPDLDPLILLPLIFITAVLSHILIDCIADITYHVPDARLNDKFWLSYHIIIFLLTGIMLILFTLEYWIAFLGSMFFDLVDWILLRAILKKEPIFHPIVDKIRSIFFSWLPNYREEKWAVANEVIIVGLIAIGFSIVKLFF